VYAFGFEKVICDPEAVQTAADDDAIGTDALVDVQPGGHFF